ncbi:MAG TPA: amino acid adenylation domain-containing protein [Symbiobacteriaceae bacterium]|nr:amino acid adenylation domain-containing protein [Symbiobacteriaceae bacterium]
MTATHDKDRNRSAERQALLNKWLSGKGGAESRIAPRSPGLESIPAAASQERLWFLEQFTPGSAAYHLPVTYRMSGALDLPVLERSLRALIQRHEALRTAFRSEDGRLTQVIREDVYLPLTVADLSSLPEAERERALAQGLTEQYSQPFDLTRGPLFRATLFRLADTDHVLLLTLHHMIADGWSNTLIGKELGALYTAFHTGAEPSLPALPIQFADYACWHQQWLQGPEMERQIAFWRQALEGVDPLLQLPTDHARPPVQGAEGGTVPFAVDRACLAGLRRLNQQEGTTLFMLLMAAFQTFLHRYTGQRDIVVGMPVFNRNRPETERVVGFFANTHVIRTQFEAEPTFRSVLQSVKRFALEAVSRQEVPFERIVEALSLPRDPSRTPLCQAMLTVAAGHETAAAWSDLTVQPHPVQRVGAMFDLTLEVSEQEDGLGLCLVYRTDLFDRETVERMAGNFAELLGGIASQPDASVSRLPILSEAERRQLAEWNATARAYPGDRMIHERFADQALQTPDRIALTCEEQHLSYAELNRCANRVAHFLRKRGVTRGTLVAVGMERSVEMVVGLLAILKAGAAYIPIDPTYPDERVAAMLEDAAPAVLLTQSHLQARFAGKASCVIALDGEAAQIAQEPGTNPDVDVEGEDLAYVIFTSGSTGRPKGAMNSHGGISNRLLWMQEAYQLGPDDAVLQKTPFSFDVSVWEFFWPLMTGARLVMARPGGHKDVEYLTEVITSERVTTLHFVPSMLQMFLHGEHVERCTSLRRVICSGEALSYELQERFFERLKADLHNLYGPTEAAVDVTYWQCRPHDERRLVPIGRPVANTQMHLLDAYQQPVPIGVVGELYIGGVQVGKGYLNRPDLTVERFVTLDLGAGPERLYRTGDLGRWLQDGTIEYLGRTDGQVKVRGVRMELGEIEAALRQHPAIKEALVLVHRVSDADVRLVAYYTGAAESLTASELRQFLLQILPEYMLPAAFVPLAAFPISPNGKVDRKALPRLDEFPTRTGAAQAALENDTERQIAGVWAEVLRLPAASIGADDNVFDLGGNSLLVLQISEVLRTRLQLSVSVVDLFRYTTVRRLAQFLDQRDQAAPAKTQAVLDRASRQRAAMMQRRDKNSGGR